MVNQILAEYIKQLELENKLLEDKEKLLDAIKNVEIELTGEDDREKNEVGY